MQDIRKTKTQLIAELSAMRRQMEVLKKAMPLSGPEEDIPGVKRTGNEIRDITDRMRAEEELHQSENRYRMLIENLHEGIVVADNDGKISFVNPRMSEMLGYSVEEMQGNLLSSFIYNPGAKTTERHPGRSEQQAEKHCDYGFICRDGSIIHTTVATVPVKGKHSTDTVVISAITDITERKIAEEKLKESEQRWMDIIDFLPDATFAIDIHGKVIAWNHAMEDLTGIRAADMLNKGDYEYALPFYGKRRPMIIDLVLSPDNKVEKSYRLMIKEQDNILMMEALVPCLKGGNSYLWGKASRLYDGKGNIVGAIEAIRDITKHKQTEAAIRKREKEFKAKKRELEDFNAALEILLKKREHDKRDLEDKIMSNVKMLILPHIEKLKESLKGSKALSHISILDANLQEIVSPFAQKLSAQYMNLTSREIQIADLIKANKSTKEISEFLNISEGAVNIHRHRIRQKLNLTKKHNLRAYFESLA